MMGQKYSKPNMGGVQALSPRGFEWGGRMARKSGTQDLQLQCFLLRILLSSLGLLTALLSRFLFVLIFLYFFYSHTQMLNVHITRENDRFQLKLRDVRRPRLDNPMSHSHTRRMSTQFKEIKGGDWSTLPPITPYNLSFRAQISCISKTSASPFLAMAAGSPSESPST